jgi:uncharacterized protein (TIRG00374 family)
MVEKVKTSNWRLILTVITIIALVLLIVGLHKEIYTTLKDLKKINLFVLALLIPVEFFNYHAQAKLYETSFGTLGKKLKYWFLFRFSLELNFISTIFPSGGLSGFSYINLRLKSQGVTTAQATLIQLIKTVLLYSSFLIILVVGLLFLAISGRASEFLIFIASSIVTFLVLISFGSLYVVSDKGRIKSFFSYITKFLNRLIKIVRPKHSETINIKRVEDTFGELHDGYLRFRDDKKALKKPFMWALLANVTEVGAVYVVYIAFGHWVNPGAIIIAYAVATFAGILSVLPGGIGVYETLMTLVLAAAGISPSLTIPVTIMYRIVNTLIQLIPGYIYYQKALRPEANSVNG